MINQQSAQFFNKPVKKLATVHDNAHSGNPYVVPWIPQSRREQPNERIKTFTKKPLSNMEATTVPFSVAQVTGIPSK